MRKFILVLSLFIGSYALKAQQELQVSQYMFNGLFLNPAYAGSHPYTSASILHRRQWVSFPGAPVTYLASIDGPIKGKNMGLGFHASTDQIGLLNVTDAMVSYAYHIKTSEKGKLSLGIRAGVQNYRTDFGRLENIQDPNDPIYQNNISLWIPKVGFGAYYYTDRFYAGLSLPTLWAYDRRNNASIDLERGSYLTRHYFINAGYVFDINRNVKFKPSALLKIERSAPIQADINANFLFNDRFWIGVGYRTNAEVMFMVEYWISPNFRAGYAFDYSTNRIRGFSGGSHEIMIGFDFLSKLQNRIKNPRYF